MATYKFNVKTNNLPVTAFEYLKYRSGISTRLFNKFKQNGTVFINDTEARINSLVSNNDEIRIEFDEDTTSVQPENIQLDVIYEDQSLIAVSKPANMVVHPTCYHQTGTLANGIAYYLQSQNLHVPIRPVIRLDKDTSGLVIFAKNALVQQSLINEMKRNSVIKTYIALVDGVPLQEEGTINAPIARLPGSIISRRVSDDGAVAITDYKVMRKYRYYSLLEVRPKTGRTHQIRVHMQYIGHPIVGDTLYGDESKLIGRQALHAFRYEFTHPETQKQVVLECPVPDDIKNLI